MLAQGKAERSIFARIAPGMQLDGGIAQGKKLVGDIEVFLC